MILYNNFYRHSNPVRQNELDTCFVSNLTSRIFDKIVLVCNESDVDYAQQLVEFNHGNCLVEYVVSDYRPTYSDFFGMFSEDSINILSNSDIYFDSTLSLVEHYLNENSCVALSRWDLDGSEYTQQVGQDSQDVWIFFGMPDVVAEFSMGIPGCDNRLAYLLQDSGYNLYNPATRIKTYHLHTSQLHTYVRGKDVIKGPYSFIPIT